MAAATGGRARVRPPFRSAAAERPDNTHRAFSSLPRADVCVKFAANQPAPRGNMAVHCGGPGSLSDCVYNLGSRLYLGTDNVENYNLIAFDQASA